MFFPSFPGNHQTFNGYNPEMNLTTVKLTETPLMTEENLQNFLRLSCSFVQIPQTNSKIFPGGECFMRKLEENSTQVYKSQNEQKTLIWRPATDERITIPKFCDQSSKNEKLSHLSSYNKYVKIKTVVPANLDSYCCPRTAESETNYKFFKYKSFNEDTFRAKGVSNTLKPLLPINQIEKHNQEDPKRSLTPKWVCNYFFFLIFPLM